MPYQNERLSLPFLLIYNRLILGLIIPTILILGVPQASILATLLIIGGLITDVFDGIIARRMGISSESLRIWDSNVDQFFWLAIISSVFYIHYQSILPHLKTITIVIILEVIAYTLSYIKFNKSIATHSILAKIWTLCLMVWIIEIILCQSNYTFPICFGLGIISRVEIILIIIMLKKWVTDVPSIIVVGKINRGEGVKKSKWFNG